MPSDELWLNRKLFSDPAALGSAEGSKRIYAEPCVQGADAEVWLQVESEKRRA